VKTTRTLDLSRSLPRINYPYLLK